MGKELQERKWILSMHQGEKVVGIPCSELLRAGTMNMIRCVKDEVKGFISNYETI